tara:strand:+ start:30 stop:317 length:288 start_codon:yes stop_codon:yes gene_type:complete
MVAEVEDLHRHQPLTYKVIQEDLEVEMLMTQHLCQHHQVMFNQQVHHKETMVVEVDKVGVMVQVEVVEPQLLVELVVHQVVELLLEQVELEQQIV